MIVKLKRIVAILTGCILMILASASTVWIIVGIQMLEKIIFMDVYYINLINALLPVGVVAGTIIFSIAAELVGRKQALLSIAVPYTVAFIMFQFARSIHVACIGRVIAGLAVGGTYTVLPIYIGELAAPSSRGILGSMMTVFSLIGVLCFYLIAIYTTYTAFNAAALGIATIFFFAFILFGQESPYYTEKRMRHDSPEKTAKEIELNDDHYICSYDLWSENVKTMSCLGSYGCAKAMVMMLLLVFIYHLTGVSMIPMLLHYAASYLGYRDINITYSSVLLASVCLELTGSIICTALVDKLGRKPCLMISSICIAIFYIPIAILAAIREKYLEVDPMPPLTIAFVVMFLVFFYIGIAPVPHILLGELFPLRFKMAAAAFIVSFHHATFFLFTNYFQEISTFVGYTLMLFIFMTSMLITPVLVYFLVLETRDKSLYEIQRILKNK